MSALCIEPAGTPVRHVTTMHRQRNGVTIKEPKTERERKRGRGRERGCVRMAATRLRCRYLTENKTYPKINAAYIQ